MEHYDEKGAADALERIAQERAGNEHCGMQLSQLTKDEDWLSHYYTVEETNLRRWRLGLKNEDDTVEEAVFSVQGIIIRQDLPPFTNKDNLRRNRVRYLKQSITLTGFDTSSFQASVGNISSIYAIFTRCVPPTKLQALTPDEYEGHPTIFASNRLFTPRTEGLTEAAVDLGRDVDPEGKLQELTQGTFFHSEDNKVHYWERVSQRQGGYKFLPISPTKIQNGDVVEAKLSFIIVPLRGGSFKMMVVLRELTILDGTFTNKAITVRASTSTLPKTHATLKRKVGYMDEEVGEARSKINRMNLSQ